MKETSAITAKPITRVDCTMVSNDTLVSVVALAAAVAQMLVYPVQR